MARVTRRALVGMAAASALAGVGAGAPKTSRVAASRTTGPVDFTVDGFPFTTTEYADLLGRLAAAGRIGADEYSRGGEVEALEARFAELLGKESAVFMPSGTLANLLAVRRLAGTRRRVIVQADSHLFNDTGDGAAQLSQLTLVPLSPGKATLGWADVEAALARTASGRVATEVGVLSIESPVRRLHGQVFDFETMRSVCAEARQRGIARHLDGARLFVAAAYSGRAPAEYAALFDTVYVSLWKCFSAGGGAVLAGPTSVIADLYQTRRMFGGALWNAWPYAAIARHQAEGYLERLTKAVRVSEALTAALAADPAFTVERVENGTSLFRLIPKTAELESYRRRLAARGIAIGPPDGAGFWLKVNETLAEVSPGAVAAAFRAALPPV